MKLEFRNATFYCIFKDSEDLEKVQEILKHEKPVETKLKDLRPEDTGKKGVSLGYLSEFPQWQYEEEIQNLTMERDEALIALARKDLELSEVVLSIDAEKVERQELEEGLKKAGERIESLEAMKRRKVCGKCGGRKKLIDARTTYEYPCPDCIEKSSIVVFASKTQHDKFWPDVVPGCGCTPCLERTKLNS